MFTVFQPKRTKDKKFAGWLKSVPGNVYQAYCSTCRKNLRIPVEYDGDQSSRITLGQHQTQRAKTLLWLCSTRALTEVPTTNKRICIFATGLGTAFSFNILFPSSLDMPQLRI